MGQAMERNSQTNAGNSGCNVSSGGNLWTSPLLSPLNFEIGLGNTEDFVHDIYSEKLL